MATINGTPADDGLEGTGGSDTINGLGGHDTLVGLGGNDILNGGEGDDLLVGGAGQDLLDGGAGYDLAVFSLSTSAVTVDLRITTAQNTGEGSDVLTGIEGLIGSDYNDWLSGDSWHNLIAGGLGNDQIFGHAGDDELIGNEGADRLEGGDGDDILTGAAGDDIVIGGAGFDLAAFHTATAGVRVDLRITTAQNTGQGSDTLTSIEDLLGSDFNDVLIGDDNSNYIDGGLGADSLSGGGGDDILAMQGGGTVSVQIDGGSGYDVFEVLNGGTLTGSTFTGIEHLHSGSSLALGVDQFDDFQTINAYSVGVSTAGLADLRNTNITAQTIHAFSGGGVLTLSGNALRNYTIWGYSNGDNITGGALNDLIRGFGGSDTLNGDAGDDFIQGEDGDDQLFGGYGVDSLDGGHGTDVLRGGAGSDGLNGGYGNDTLYGEDGDDHLADDLGNNILDGGAGNDTITVSSYAANGANQAFGGAGDDTIVYDGSRERLNSATYNGGEGYDTFRVELDYSSSDPTPIADLTGFDLSTFERVDGLWVRLTIAQIQHVDVIASNLYVDGSGLLDLSGVGGAPSTIHFGAGAITLDLTGQQYNSYGTWYGIWVYGGAGNDEVRGGVNADRFQGGAGDDILLGAEGDDILGGQAGNDIINGGEGRDIARFSGMSSDYQFAFEGDALRVTGAEGSDTLISIEEIWFEGGGGRFLFGSAEADNLVGSEADDVLFGGDGADFMNGVSGNDTIGGGGGDDELWGYGGADMIDGGAGDDLIRGFHGDDVITGGAGDDRIDGAYDGSEGSSTDIAVYSGNRADYGVVHADGYHYVVGADGVDTLLNIDFLRFADGQYAISEISRPGTVLSGGSAGDALTGTAGDDILRGAGGNDTLSGVAGNDLVYGGDGDDVIDVGPGLDTAFGDGGNDTFRVTTMTSGQPDSTVDGGAGVDTFDASAVNVGLQFGSLVAGRFTVADYSVVGVERVIGGSGDDYMSLWRFTTALEMLGGAGGDYVEGGSAADRLDGGAGGDQLYGRAGQDILIGGTGADFIDGGDGTDTAVFTDGAATVSVAGGVVTVTGPDGVDSLTNVERLRFGAGEVAVAALAASNRIGTSAGETLTGSSSAQALFGLAGADSLNGGDGDDRLSGGAGVDILNGGLGIDTADYSSAAAGMRAQLNTNASSNDGDGGTDTFSSIENLTGSAFNDVLIGDGAANVLRGGTGADTLLGLAGADVLWGGSGALNTLQGGLGDDRYVLEAADSITELAGEGTDTVEARINTYTLANHVENLIFGGTGAFAGTGNALANVITGGAGNDALRGRGGVDTLNGGLGTDTADYTLAAARVVVRLDLQKATNDGDGATDTFSSIESAIGSNFNDVMYGDAGANVLMGGIGSDVLVGGGGDDVLWGGSGGVNNQLQGGAGNDRYVLEAFDTCVELAGEGVDTVEARIGSYTLGSNLENLIYAGPGKFVGSGNALDNHITGGALNDILRGGGGNDVIDGGLGRDELQLRGSKAQYTVTAEGSGWRIVDSVAGRDGSTLVSSIEGLRFMTGNTTTVLTYGAPAAPEPAGKAGDAQVLPLPADLDDAFVLPALAEGEPLVLPGLEAFKPADAPLVLPGTGDEAPLFLALGARLAPAGGWMAVIDDQGRLLADPGRHGDDWMA